MKYDRVQTHFETKEGAADWLVAKMHRQPWHVPAGIPLAGDILNSRIEMLRAYRICAALCSEREDLARLESARRMLDV